MQNNAKVLFIICLTAVSLVGCATTTSLTSIPTTNEEFSQSIATIRDKYSDVSLYEPQKYKWRDMLTFKSPPPRPAINALESQWGSPQRIERKWGEWSTSTLLVWVLGAVTGQWWVSGVTTIVFFPPVETYHWYKETSHVEARVTHFIFHGYEGRLASWQWREENPNSTIQNNVPELNKTSE